MFIYNFLADFFIKINITYFFVKVHDLSCFLDMIVPNLLSRKRMFMNSISSYAVQQELGTYVSLAVQTNHGGNWGGLEENFRATAANLSAMWCRNTNAIGDIDTIRCHIFTMRIPQSNERLRRVMGELMRVQSMALMTAADENLGEVEGCIAAAGFASVMSTSFDTKKALQAIYDKYQEMPALFDFYPKAAIGHRFFRWAFRLAASDDASGNNTCAGVLSVLSCVLTSPLFLSEEKDPIARLIFSSGEYRGVSSSSLMIVAKKIALTVDGFGEVIKFFMQALAPNRQHSQLLAEQLAERTVITKDAQRLLDDKSPERQDDRMALLGIWPY